MLSIIAVNYNSSALLKECYLSIISTIGKEPFEFFVIDSGSKEDDANKLLELEKDNVRIILNRENIGYAKAVNIGVKISKGDKILITNPDVIYRAESIVSMSNALSMLPKCGAVGPKTWWNKEMDFLLPLSKPITPYGMFITDLSKTSKTMNNIFLKRWIKSNLQYWLSDNPLKQEMLSGACIMTKRTLFEKTGGFDEIFPLYFEDADWCLRVRNAGYYLYMVPQAEIIHYYNQSAKKDITSSRQKFNDSMNKYYGKHFNKQVYLFNMIQGLWRHKSDKTFQIYEDTGMLDFPPVFSFQDCRRKLFLLSPVETLMPSAGSFFESDSFIFPEDLWSCLGEGRYFMRCFYPDSFINCGSWSWVKHS